MWGGGQVQDLDRLQTDAKMTSTFECSVEKKIIDTG